jgi:hypothetical protein
MILQLHIDHLTIPMLLKKISVDKENGNLFIYYDQIRGPEKEINFKVRENSSY